MPEARRRRKSRSSEPAPARRRARASDPSQSALELQTLQEFRLIFASTRAHDAEVRRLAGISGSQLWALSEIARDEGMSVNELSESMAVHQTTASNLVNALVERRLIRRERDDADLRIVRLHVTTDGKRILLRAPGPYTGLLVDALRKLNASQIRQLRKSLGILIGMLRDTHTSATGETLLGE